MRRDVGQNARTKDVKSSFSWEPLKEHGDTYEPREASSRLGRHVFDAREQSFDAEESTPLRSGFASLLEDGDRDELWGFARFDYEDHGSKAATEDEDEEEDQAGASDYEETADTGRSMATSRPGGGRKSSSTIQSAPRSKLVQRMFRTLDPEDDAEAESDGGQGRSESEERPAPAASMSAEFASKLQEEMGRFKETNERLQVSLKQLDVDRRHLAQERLELDKEKRQLGKESSAQIEQMRAELRKERAHLQRERVALERQKQHIEVLRETVRVERKDRGQVDSLQATIARMRVSEKEKAAKHKEAMQSKRERIAVLEREADQMQNALRFAEERRLDLWGQLSQAQEALEASEAEKKDLVAQLEALRAAGSAQPPLRPGISPLRDPGSNHRQRQQPPQQARSFPSPGANAHEPLSSAPHLESESEVDSGPQYTKNPAEAQDVASPTRGGVEDDEARGQAVGLLKTAERGATGGPGKKKSQRKQRVHADGSRTITFADGTIKEIQPDGEQTVTFPNGDIKKRIPREGLEIYYFAASDTSQTTYSDGMVVCEFPNGQVERKHPSGVQEIFYSDGAVKTMNPDGAEETLFPDGTKVEVSASGQRKVLRAVLGAAPN